MTERTHPETGVRAARLARGALRPRLDLLGAVLGVVLAGGWGCGRTDFVVANEGSCATSADVYVVRAASADPQPGAYPAAFSDACAVTIESAATSARGTYRLLWSERALFILLETSDPDLAAIVTTRDGETWTDDSLEVSFDTLHDRGVEMHQDDYKFGVNILNAQTDVRGVGWRDPPWNTTIISSATTTGTINDDQDVDAGYSIEVEIPFASWGIAVPAHGAQWGMTLILNDRAHDEAHQTAWVGPPENVPDDWGTAVFFAP